MDSLKVYNHECDSIDEFDKYVKKFNETINDEICQATKCKPKDLFVKEKEHLSNLINDRILDTYKEAVTRKVTNESVINFQSAKYSVPTAYVGKIVELSVKNNQLHIYYNKILLTIHDISEKIYNYKPEHIKLIAASDAYKNASDEELNKVVQKRLDEYDKYGWKK